MKRTITSLKLRMVAMMVALVASFSFSTAYAQTKLTLLSGSRVDGSSESCAALIDGNFTSKWGQSFFKDNTPWIVFKSDVAVVPTTYFLITGNDTGSFPDRNWSSWKIYGANFASDDEATRTSDAWVLIDNKESFSLPTASLATAQLTFSEATTTAYTHFRIEVLAINSFNEDIYSQMSEFGFGSPEDAEINYLPVQGHKTGGEGADKLIDGREDTKWGFSSNDPGWFIFRTTKAIKPTYYHLVTGHDSRDWTGRGWKDYTIYGGNFENDDAAKAAFEANQEDREFVGWTILEKRTGVGNDVIPDENCAHVYLDMETPATEAYTYFMIIVDKALVDGNWCQMAEFTWGNPEIFLNTRNNLYNEYDALDRDQLTHKALIEEYEAALQELSAISEPTAIAPATAKLDEIKSRINTCAEAYKTYVAMVEGLIKDIANGKVTSEEGLALLNTYVNEEIAPNETYPAGTYKYIIANRHLDVDAIKAEATRLGGDMELYVAVADPLDVTYELISGSDGFSDAEGPGSLIDGLDDTKWCHMHNNGLSYVIFKTSDPVVATYIRLFTSNDTGSNWGRNWKKWKVFAANFDSDEAATIDAEGWTVIDDQSDAQLPRESNKAVFRYLSNPSDTPYQYFKIEIYESANDDRMQMSGFEFGNQGNFRQIRATYVEEFTFFKEGIQGLLATKALVEEFDAKLIALTRVATIDEMGVLYNELMNLQNEITESIDLYSQYQTLVENDYIPNVQYIEDAVENALQSKYIGEEAIAPCEMLANGSYQYIIQNGSLDASALKKEIELIESYIKAINSYGELPVVLGGASSHWGDGHYKQLVDGDNTTKWGGGIPADGMYVIFKMLSPFSPFFYGLETGGDTEVYTGRNWKSWNIYAANFQYDSQATRDSEGWVLIDHKENIGQDRLKPTNNTISYFGYSTEIPAEGYRYFMVEVLEAYSGTSVQMQEMLFGTEDDFADIRDEYFEELNAHMSEEIVADAALIAQYQEYLDAVETSEDIEEMFVTYYKAVAFWSVVETSANVYARYMKAMADLLQYLDVTALEESEALATLENYIEGEEEPSAEGFPNGSYNYIVENHLLTDSAVYAEIEYLNELKAAAVAMGYVPGAEITAMLKNPTFEKKSEGWAGDSIALERVITQGDAENGFYTGGESVIDTFNIYQTLTGLKNGVYMFELTAGFRACGDTLSTNHAATIYANENKTYIQTVVEGAIPFEEAVDKGNCSLSGAHPEKTLRDDEGNIIGYILWAPEGVAYAAKGGRYNNVIVANVTDGTLTVGIENPGTANVAGGERVILANARLTYLGDIAGEEAVAGIDSTLRFNVARANTLLSYVPSVGADYASKPNFSYEERNALTTAIEAVANATTVEEKYALIAQFTSIFQDIYDTKNDYITLMDAEIDVYEKWGNEATYMSEDELAKFEGYTAVVQSNWIEGAYTADQALAMADELYATYPDYMNLDFEKYEATAEETIAQSAPFTYDITLDESTMFSLAGFYDDLNEEETILTFEYKSAGAFVPTLYFANPSPLQSNNLTLEDMDASADTWKRVYYNVQFARDGMFSDIKSSTWGAESHWLLWQIAGAGETVSIRNVQVITRAAMEAAGGTVGITGVADDATLQQEGIYTLSGVRVEKATRGLYIKDGRKVIVK